MAKLSIITPSIRERGLEIVEIALKRQTFKDWEWIVGSPAKPNLNIPFVWVQDPPKKEGDYWTLYKTYNECIRQSSGELVVSIQDYTFFKPDTLERFYLHYQDEPKTIVGAVGNKYTSVYPELGAITWQDPRIRDEYGSYYEVNFNDIELNLGSFPKQAFYEVGGFDEELDKYSSLCGLDVLARLDIIGGWKFKLDQTINSFSLEHGRLPDWEKKNPFNNGVWVKKLKEYEKNPILNFLK